MLHRSTAVVVLCLCLGTCLLAASTGVWLDVPFIKQEKNACGAASLAMVMQYWQRQQGKSADENADAVHIQQALFSRHAKGIFASDMQGYLENHNFQAFAFEGTWADLKQNLEKGRPLIVALQPAHNGSLHYVVVTGLDWQQQLVLTNDPAQRKLLKEDRANFEKEWKATRNWTLLAVPRQEH
ncbi:MAG TPA: C39 family peptidase [Terriglobales bacterium]|nr:C39 family peptidase [Terriglobales bacterium]